MPWRRASEWVARAIDRAVRRAPPVPLGRWSLLRDERAVSTKVLQANHDHCGACGPLVQPRPSDGDR